MWVLSNLGEQVSPHSYKTHVKLQFCVPICASCMKREGRRFAIRRTLNHASFFRERNFVCYYSHIFALCRVLEGLIGYMNTFKFCAAGNVLEEQTRGNMMS